MQNYGQYCPIAKAAEVLGDRWTLLILRDMHTGALHFNELHRGLPGISRSVLTQRLRQLERDELIKRLHDERNKTTGYELTAAGNDLAFVLSALTDWVNRWVMDDPTPAELDPRLLLLWFSRIVDPSSFGEQRFVAEFQMTGPNPGRSWIVVEEGVVSLCLDDPCLDIDLWVTADTAALYQVFMGRQPLMSAVADDLVDLHGAPERYAHSCELLTKRRCPTWSARERRVASVRTTSWFAATRCTRRGPRCRFDPPIP